MPLSQSLWLFCGWRICLILTSFWQACSFSALVSRLAPRPTLRSSLRWFQRKSWPLDILSPGYRWMYRGLSGRSFQRSYFRWPEQASSSASTGSVFFSCFWRFCSEAGTGAVKPSTGELLRVINDSDPLRALQSRDQDSSGPAHVLLVLCLYYPVVNAGRGPEGITSQSFQPGIPVYQYGRRVSQRRRFHHSVGTR